MPVEESLQNDIDQAIETVTAEVATQSDDSGSERETAVVSEAEEESQPVDETEEPASAEDAGKEETDEKPAGDDNGENEALPTREISDEALTQAVSAGIPLADAREFKSEESLLRVVDAVRRAAKPSEEATAEKQTAKDDEDPFASLPKLDPDNYEPEVIEMFEKLTGIVKQQHGVIQDFRGHQQQAAQAAEAAASREVETWFDSQVAALGEDFSEALGEGGYGALAEGSAQHANRTKIADQMSVLLAGYKASGQQAPPRDEVFDAAARLVLKDEYQKIHEKKLTGELANRSKQHLQRPGGQKATSKLTPEEDTAALLDAKYPSR